MGAGCSVMCLSSLPFLLHHTDAAMKQVGVAFPLPAVLQVPLTHFGLVEKSVVVHIMMSKVILIVSQYFCAQPTVPMDVCIGIHFQTA